jgi:IS6 family transposase
MATNDKHTENPFKWKHYNGEIILWCVSWYGRYALSYRDLVEMAAERGLELTRSTIMRWVHEYAPEIKRRLTPYFKRTHGSWRVDETYIWIKGRQHYLYRAIDKYGQTLDWYVSPKRDKKAAKTFFKKTLGNPYVDTSLYN